jgi:3-phosphoshikimate 1-carboxyvinyltransferase
MLALLERMGCKVTYNEDGEGIELMGPALTELRGGFTVSMKEMSDQTLTLAVLAVFADAPITITDVEHIRAHECDRIQAICESLNLLGIRVEERKDGMKIFPGTPQPPLSAMNTYDDHRMAMSLALIGARVGGIRLRDPGCVSKTCPDYFEQLRSLGMRVQ